MKMVGYKHLVAKLPKPKLYPLALTFQVPEGLHLTVSTMLERANAHVIPALQYVINEWLIT